MKRIFCLLVATLMIFLTIEVPFATASSNELPPVPAPVPPSVTEGARGDADNNGTVNYMDAMLVLRHSVGLETLKDEIVIRCDVDGSGALSYMDAMLILRYSVGLIESFD